MHQSVWQQTASSRLGNFEYQRIGADIGTGDAQALLAASLCRFAQYENQAGLQYFKVALFRYPGLRLLAEGDLTEDPYHVVWSRGAVPDAELMALNLLVMDQASPRVNPILRMMLEHRDVLAAEMRLAGLYAEVKMERAKGNHTGRDRAIANWQAASGKRL